MDGEIVKIVNYRDYNIPVYIEDDELYFFIDKERINLGYYNGDWERDLRYLVDFRLDTIQVFSEINTQFSGAILEWFQNGEFRDIRLKYNNRVLKIFIVVKPEEINKKKIIAESVAILTKIIV